MSIIERLKELYRIIRKPVAPKASSVVKANEKCNDLIEDLVSNLCETLITNYDFAMGITDDGIDNIRQLVREFIIEYTKIGAK